MIRKSVLMRYARSLAEVALEAGVEPKVGADFAGLGLGSVSGSIPFPGRDGKPPISPMRPVLAHERVMHVGEPVAMVIASTRAQAEDAADLVNVDYETLDAVIDLAQAAVRRVAVSVTGRGMRGAGRDRVRVAVAMGPVGVGVRLVLGVVRRDRARRGQHRR